jgi:hypothetical protein
MRAVYQQKLEYIVNMNIPNIISGCLLNLKPGKIKRIKGINKARNIVGVRKILFMKKAGDVIGNLKDNTDVPGFVWISGKTRREMNETYKKVMGTIKIEYE